MKRRSIRSWSTVRRAVGLLWTSALAAAYEDAWESWNASDDATPWDATTADGFGS